MRAWDSDARWKTLQADEQEYKNRCENTKTDVKIHAEHEK